ncbi:hypothetical protein THAOC_25994, partial [Thalassiosira oceanica]
TAWNDLDDPEAFDRFCEDVNDFGILRWGDKSHRTVRSCRAELGVKEAHYNLGILYANGACVEKDTAKAIHHFEAAAMCGHVPARYSLGYMEGMARNHVIAFQHFLMSAKLGYDDSLKAVKRMFMAGLANKADYAAALRR